MAIEVKITKRYLKNLERAYSKLEALEAGGVCNWDGYSFALDEFRKEEKLDELIAKHVDNICQTVAEDCTVEYPSCREAGAAIMFPDGVEEQIENWVRKFLQEAIELKGEKK